MSHLIRLPRVMPVNEVIPPSMSEFQTRSISRSDLVAGLARPGPFSSLVIRQAKGGELYEYLQAGGSVLRRETGAVTGSLRGKLSLILKINPIWEPIPAHQRLDGNACGLYLRRGEDGWA